MTYYFINDIFELLLFLITLLMILTNKIVNNFARMMFKHPRKAKFYKPKFCEAMPHYLKPHFIDIHDTYKLRSKD